MAIVRRFAVLLFLVFPLFAFAQADVSVSVTDSPDPVAPDGSITYTVTVGNAGPNLAPNVSLSTFGSNNLRYQSHTAPAGWSCTVPASGTQTTSLSCTNAGGIAASGNSVLTFVMQADDAIFGVNDTTIQFGFQANSSVSDPVPGNNTEVESTAYVTPDADIALTVSDSPDPVFPDGNITYTVTVSNNGPDLAPSVTLNSFGSNNLRYQSHTAPAGWNCTVPAAGTQTTSLTCTLPGGMAPGGSSILTFVMQADDAIFGVNDGTIQFGFTAGSTISDPVPGNNAETESTAYTTPDADIAIAVSDSPDPVNPDGNITYTVTVSNNGPDTAPSVTLSSFGGNNLRYQSHTAPAGWNCTVPAPGTQTTSLTCSLPGGLVSGGTSILTFVMQADDAILGINDQTINFGFTATSPISDPVPGNNTETESTAYTAADADVSVTVSDSPDPVSPDGNITYTVTVANAGPDLAPNVTLSSFGGNNLRYQSATVPAGWNCTLPSAGTQTTSLTCTLPGGLASGGSSVLTFVMQADDALLGINDTTINFGFTATSTVSDPVPGNNTETESTAYVTPDADLAITASDSPDPVGPDQNITYTVTVQNNGPDTASATLIVPMNGTLKFTGITAPAGFTCSGVPAPGTASTFSCNNSSFASGATAIFTIVLNADADAFGNSDQTIVQNFNVTGNLADPNNTNNSVNVSTAYDVPNADLSVTASDAPDPVAAGSSITYTGFVASAGPDTATNVTFTIPLSANLLFQSLTGPAGFTCTTPAVGTTGTITCTAASLPSGASIPYTLVAQVNPGLSSGPDYFVQQQFMIGSSTNDPNGTNNNVTVDTAYTTPDADLVVTNSDSPDPVATGGTITYTQTITNNGPDAATNATFTQSTPAGTTFQSFVPAAGWTCGTPAIGATGAITCAKAAMTSGETGAFTLVVNVTAASGTITSVVTGDSDTYDPNALNNDATAVTNIGTPGSADLSATISTTATTPPAGSTYPYTITVTNSGPDAATNVVVSDPLPSGLLFRSITTPAGFVCTTPAVGTNGTVTCTVATMPSGTTSTFTLIVEVAPGATGPIVNGIDVSSATPDPDSGDTSPDAAPIVPGPAVVDLTIAKSTASTVAVTGSNITYTIAVGNAGPSSATNVTVSDTLPVGLTFVSATPSQGTCNAVSPVVCTLGTIAAGGNATITLVAQVTATSGTITNTATVVATEQTVPESASTPPVPVQSTGEPIAAIPTLSEWMLMMLAGLLGIAALVKMRA